MKKLRLLLSIILSLSLLNPIQVMADESIPLQADFAYSMDTTSNRELFSKNGEKKIYPASMTKVVTCIVAIEAIKDINATATIEESDVDGLFEANASVAGFYVGEEVTYLDLLCGSLLPSGADASNALARLTYGDVKSFVGKMNELCTKLGLENTQFTNPTGLHSPSHYTTCKEMATLVQYAFNNPTFKKVYETKEYVSSNGLHEWHNTLYSLSEENDLEYDYVVGAKTGFTDEAENCVASVIDSEGHEVISILAHDEHRVNLLNDLKEIQIYLDKTYDSISLDPVLVKKRFKYTFKKKDVYREKENNLYLPYNYDEDKLDIDTHFDVKMTPIEENSIVGTYSISYDGIEIEKGNLIVKDTIKRNFFLYSLFKFVLQIIIILFILLCIRRYLIIQRRKRRKKRRQQRR